MISSLNGDLTLLIGIKMWLLLLKNGKKLIDEASGAIEVINRKVNSKAVMNTVITSFFSSHSVPV